MDQLVCSRRQMITSTFPSRLERPTPTTPFGEPMEQPQVRIWSNLDFMRTAMSPLEMWCIFVARCFSVTPTVYRVSGVPMERLTAPSCTPITTGISPTQPSATSTILTEPCTSVMTTEQRTLTARCTMRDKPSSATLPVGPFPQRFPQASTSG